jgi:hypothetical protein
MFNQMKSLLAGLMWVVRYNGLRETLRRTEQRVGLIHAQVTRRIPGDLREAERQVHSQSGEDGIIQAIFARIGTGPKFFVEFGVQSGVQCNCARLVYEEGWGGLFIEMDPADHASLQARFGPYKGVTCAREKVTAQNIESILRANQVPAELDLLSIDIDGNDYWVWSAINDWRPRVVVIEYNASYAPPTRWVMAENNDHVWDGTNYHGASLASLVNLGRKKGYELVATTTNGVNAFFVRQDLMAAGGFVDPVLFYHYSPPGYGPGGVGHPGREGPAVEG